jgi:hypothetical protein
MLRHKTGSMMALENIKNDNQDFLCEPLCFRGKKKPS